MEAQIENAVEIASNPVSDASLKTQAFEFVNNIRFDQSYWEATLNLFVKKAQSSQVVRIVALEALCNYIEKLELSAISHVRSQLFEYARQSYSVHSNDTSELDNGAIRNKLAQAFSCLFMSLYADDWISFFDDIISLGASSPDSLGTDFYLRILSAIHDDIADSMITRNSSHPNHTKLKDLIRARDVSKIAASWQPILSNHQQNSSQINNLCLKVIGQWVSWIDIILVVNQDLMLPLLGMIGGSGAEGMTETSRNAIDTLTEIVTKKMPPASKMELFGFLNLDQIIQQLVESQPLSAMRNTSSYDTDLAETTAKLVNASLSDLIRIIDHDQLEDKTRAQANQGLEAFLALAIRFLSDEYDEVCSTVIPSIGELLALLRRNSGDKSHQINHRILVPPILQAIVAKMKYDETATWADDEEQTDEAEFQYLRKRLEIMQQSIANLDIELYIAAMDKLVRTTFEDFQRSSNSTDWRDLDLALHEMYLLGDLTSKSGGLYADGKPTGLAAKILVEMMVQMVSSGIAAYPHPTVQLQYMEICVRYSAFFESEQNTQFIPAVLDVFVRFVHSNHVRVKTRSWYLFQRFVRHLRGQLGNVSETVIQSISDLLQIQAHMPPESANDDDEMSSDKNESSSLFTSQLYLFEAVGCIASTSAVPEVKQAEFARIIIDPLSADIEANIPSAAQDGNKRSVLQIHHCIMALGTLARGFSDWQPGITKSLHGKPPEKVREQFMRVAEIVLTSLESLGNLADVRTASRFTFSRLFGVLGTDILPQLQRWINGLLPTTSNNDEMADFLRLLGQIIFAFKQQISDVLEALYTPLLQKISDGLGKVPAGTDDVIQLGELRREFLSMILVILNTGLGSIITSPTNQMALDPLLSTCMAFANDTGDPATAKLAFAMLSKMCSAWISPDSGLPGFKTFCLDNLIPLCWSLPASPSFDVNGPQFRLVLNEIASLHKTMYNTFTDEYISRTRAVVGQTLPENKIAGFMDAIKKMEDKDFRRWFLVSKFLQQ